MNEVSTPGLARFSSAVERLPELLRELLGADKHRVADHPFVPNAPGIYLFSEQGAPIYVGQSRKLRTRLRNHTALTARQNQASFAFNLAKAAAKREGVDTERFRAALEQDGAFTALFNHAKARVAAMDVQYVELADPIERTLFEVYAALALGTEEFNSFETH